MMNNTATTLEPPLADDPFERLHSAARTAASWDVVHRPTGASNFPSRVREARAALRKLEGHLVRLPAKPTDDGSNHPALFELKANFRLLRSAVSATPDRPKILAQLPRIVAAGPKEELRVDSVAVLYIGAAEGVFTGSTFCTFIREVQVYDPLAVDELWHIPGFLKFSLLEGLLDRALTLVRDPGSADALGISTRLKSLRDVGNTDWQPVIEPLIAFDATLREDPAATYAEMEFESREMYRKRVAYVSSHCNFTESHVALAALTLAREAVQRPSASVRLQRRRTHVGYYLLDKGFPQLAERVGFHSPLSFRIRTRMQAHGEDFYITGVQVLTVLFIAAVLFPILPQSYGVMSLVIAFALLLLPATQDAVDLVNNTITAFFDPAPLPKLDFSRGIPADCTTLVAVPTLLLNETQVYGLVNDLEVRYLANRDPHLHFALLTDLPDSVSQPRDKDSNPMVELATRLINDLEAKYGSKEGGSFMLLHRHRVFNGRQGVWMGWERKRGKLLDLNKLLDGEFDAFPIKAGNPDALRNVRYILTLDSDTELPRGTAARMAGAIAHPLNQAIIDPDLRIVTDGYGILQPRVGVTVRSAVRSRLALIYSGQTGFDIYTRAVSDVYQDLFGEGSFTGKGIYEADTVHAVLNHRFPRNALLSHDLIEGAYARAGLATDIELIDDYPSHYSAYSRRQHRWVRGDWQITRWVLSSVPDESGRMVRNPISAISRWKIFDNLRRSLVDPFLMILFVAGWLGLPGGPLYWTIVPLVLLFFPTFVQLAFALSRALANGQKSRAREALSGFWRGMFFTLLHLIFIAHQTLLAFDAIVRSLVRAFITGQRLLEWETAAQAESSARKSTPVDRYLAAMPLIAAGLAGVVWFFAPNRRAIWIDLPILLLWASAGIVTAWLDRPPHEPQRLGSEDEAFLTEHALRIWRYFYQFGGESHNYLIPDNVEEDGLYEAARVSPTNVGLLLNARQAACEFGFLTTPEFAALTIHSLATIAQLEKHRGHLYNWYDTQTLRPLDAAPFVSSVDSGNFVASLYTLGAGARELAGKPLLSPLLFAGLRTHWRLMEKENAPTLRIKLPSPSATAAEWVAWLPTAEAELSSAVTKQSAQPGSDWWVAESRQRINAILGLLQDYIPWLLQEYAPLREASQLGLGEKAEGLTIEAAIGFAEQLEARLGRAWVVPSGDPAQLVLGERLRVSLGDAVEKLRALEKNLRAISESAERLAEETEFGFLIDPNRQVLSIGYDVRARKLHDACYDMLASEARIATFLAIARGELRQQSWFKLARDHAHAFGSFVLLSWTGTMFEYLMPALWMRGYPDTLLSNTQAACVRVQRAFARNLNIPWGISESGSAKKDDAGHYHYHAYGIPQIALSAEATAGPVVSPYSTFLALSVDPHEALRNLRRMAAWTGTYGFYESADYTASTREPTLTREWMAHHQGMSLLAIVNLLHDKVVQQWFHTNPLMQSTEMLLHETPVHKATLEAALRESAPLQAS